MTFRASENNVGVECDFDPWGFYKLDLQELGYEFDVFRDQTASARNAAIKAAHEDAISEHLQSFTGDSKSSTTPK